MPLPAGRALPWRFGAALMVCFSSGWDTRFVFDSKSLAGLVTVQRKPFEDERGCFTRLFCTEEFREAGLTKGIVQARFFV